MRKTKPRKSNKRCVDILIGCFDGNGAEVARALNVTRASVNSWFHQGLIPLTQAKSVAALNIGISVSDILSEHAKAIDISRKST